MTTQASPSKPSAIEVVRLGAWAALTLPVFAVFWVVIVVLSVLDLLARRFIR